MDTIKAIDTAYKGYLFRSRLEARWAVFFDTLGIEWEYEKEGYDLGDLGWYLPDFWLPLPSVEWPAGGYWLEVKGQKPTQNELDKAQGLAAMTKHTTFVAYGMPGANHLFTAHHSGRAAWTSDRWAEEADSACALWVELLRCHVLPAIFKSGIRAARSVRFEHGQSPC